MLRIKFFFLLQFFAFWGLFAPRKATFTLIKIITQACKEANHELTAIKMGLRK